MLKGFYRIAVGIPELHLADPQENAREIGRLYDRACGEGAAVLLTPELSLTGYSCGDLFEQQMLLDGARKQLLRLRDATRGLPTILIVGLPLAVGSRLFNVAAVLQDGKICGLAGKTYLPNYREFYEQRQFRSIREHDGSPVEIDGESVPLGGGLLFDAGGAFQFGVELCEDMWAVIPPSAALALAGAKLVFNLSAGPELVAKADYRRSLVTGLAARQACIYALAGAGVHESTTDLVFSGHALVAENGRLLAENSRFEQKGAFLLAEVNPGWMEQQRRAWTSFNETPRAEGIRTIRLQPARPCAELRHRQFPQFPFVPADAADRHERCREILSIQATGLAKRVRHTHARRLVVGLSGGLDSTLALLVCARACDLLALPHDFICAVTMPGMGTTGRTYKNACALAREVGAELREIAIAAAVKQHFTDIGHDPKDLNVVYENAQARERTQILMDLANELGGLLVGTGDLSEIALGWSTYNGDHMSMYGVNAGVPKSLVRWLVEDCAAEAGGSLAKVLRDVNKTPVSPELLPGGAGAQKTEGILGSYTLHDFFLYFFIRYAETPENLLALATATFKGVFTDAQIRDALGLFLRRFFAQQFKRSCMPDGPKVGTVALSPRGDWRMPSDASDAAWRQGGPQ